MKIVRNTAFPIFVLLIAFIIINGAMSGFTSSFVVGFFTSNFALCCVTIGTAVIIMGGGIDVSLGAMVALINCIFTQLVEHGWNFGLAVVVSLLISMACGALNGTVVGFFRVSPMLATFGSLSIFSGLALTVLPLPGGTMPVGFRNFYMGTIAGIPIALLIIIALLLLAFLVHRSPLGTKIIAVGLDAPKSFISGVRVNSVTFFTYVFAGFVCGVGAIGLTANMGGGDPNVGTALSMSAIASCVIGGVALSGGKGNALGAVFGSLFFGLLINTVIAARTPSFQQGMIRGIILLVGMIVAAVLLRGTTSTRAKQLRNEGAND